MRKLFISACMAGLLAAVSSCGTSRNASSSIKALDGEWKITTIDGQALSPQPGEKVAFIGFDVKENRIYGNTGCNNLLGGLQADAANKTITFGQSGSTRMLCPHMETEQKVLEAMGKVGRYEITGKGKMSLMTADGKTVMTLEKRSK